jgi:type II secretory pathway predicted ATPase ExeA
MTEASGPPVDPFTHTRIRGARLVPTRATRRTHEDLAATLDGHKIMCGFGDYGLGKTVAFGVTLHDLAPDTTVSVQPVGTGINALRHALAVGLSIPADITAPVPRDAAITTVLSQRPHTLLCDEAQRLDTKSMEYLRALWDRKDNQLSIVLIGAHDFRRKMLARPAWKSRIATWTQFTPLTPDEVVDHMPRFHPVWEAAPEEDIPFIDNAACHGNFRAWADLTEHLNQALEKKPDLVYSRELVLWILGRMSGSPPE